MIKKFILYIKRKISIIKLFKKASKYLCLGNYFIPFGFNSFVLKEFKAMEFYNDQFDENFYIKIEKKKFKNIKKIINYFITLISFKGFNIILKKNNDSFEKFKGQIFIPFNDLQGFKVFDVNSNRVLISYLNKKEYNKKILTYNYFKPFYKIPTMYLKEPINMIVIEEIINYKKHENWKEYEYDYVIKENFKTYYNYYCNIKRKKEYTIRNIKDITNRVINNNYGNIVIDYLIENSDLEIINSKMPMIKLHGDLWRLNILLNDNYDLYYIDWDRSDDYIFIYDFFSLIWHNNNYYLKKYFNGEYNKYFLEIFSIFNIDFYKSNLLEYIILFLIIYYSKNKKKFSKSDLNDELEDIKRKLNDYIR